MSRRRFAFATAVASMVVLTAGCSSSTPGTASTTSTTNNAGTTGASITSSALLVTAEPAPAANGIALSKAMDAAAATVTSMHLDITVTSGGNVITETADEQLQGGKLIASHMTEVFPSIGTIEIVAIGATTYYKIPASMMPALGGTADKPWVDATTSNKPVFSKLNATLGSVQASGSLTSYSQYAAAMTSIKSTGISTINGAPASGYATVVDVSKIPVATGTKSALSAGGVTTFQMNIWLDSQNRLVQATQDVAAAGQSVTTNIAISKYNVPVSITTPPASQISG